MWCPVIRLLEPVVDLLHLVSSVSRNIVNRFRQLISAHGRALLAEAEEDTSSWIYAKVMFEYMERT
jgi:hypothetical protein